MRRLLLATTAIGALVLAPALAIAQVQSNGPGGATQEQPRDQEHKTPQGKAVTPTPAPARNCFSKIVVSLSRVESARFSLRLLFRNRATASLTVTRADSGRIPEPSRACGGEIYSRSIQSGDWRAFVQDWRLGTLPFKFGYSR